MWKWPTPNQVFEAPALPVDKTNFNIDTVTKTHQMKSKRRGQ